MYIQEFILGPIHAQKSHRYYINCFNNVNLSAYHVQSNDDDITWITLEGILATSQYFTERSVLFIKASNT